MNIRTKDTLKSNKFINFESVYAERIIVLFNGGSSGSILSDQLVSLVKNTDFNVCGSILNTVSRIISKEITISYSLDLLFDSISDFIKTVENVNSFKVSIFSYFNKCSVFPFDILSRLSLSSALTISTYAYGSTFSNNIREFMENYIFPRILESSKISICELVMSELCFIPFVPNEVKSYLSIPSAISSLTPVANNDNKRIMVPFFQTLQETRLNELCSIQYLSRLFSFFSDFDESYAASFIYFCISPYFPVKAHFEKMDDSSRLSLFNEYKYLFNSLKVPLSKLIQSLDQPYLSSIPTDSCGLMFQFLSTVFEPNLIPFGPLTTNWKNSSLQLSIISYIASNTVSSINYSQAERYLNLKQMSISFSPLSDTPSCWNSIAFVEKLIELSNNNSKLLSSLFSSLTDQYPALTITLIGLSKYSTNPFVSHTASSALVKVITSQNSSDIFSFLYNTCHDFAIDLVISLYHHKPQKMVLIEKAVAKQYNELVLSHDVKFAIELAFFSTTKYPIKVFFEKYVSKYTKVVLPKMIGVIKEMISASIISNRIMFVKDLNEVFSYMKNDFEHYSVETQSLIRNLYQDAENTYEGLTKIQFQVKIQESYLKEMKQRAIFMFTDLFNEVNTPEHYALIVQNSVHTEHLFVVCITHFLFGELNYLSRHNEKTLMLISKFFSLLISNSSLNKKQTQFMFNFIKNSLNESDRSPSFIFTQKLLTYVLPSLKNYPEFVFSILQETPLRDKDSYLFEKIYRIAQSMNTPLHTFYPKKLTLNPILKRFESLRPHPKVCKAIQTIHSDPITLITLISSNKADWDWIADYLICYIQDHPKQLDVFAEILISPNSEDKRRFCGVVIQASAVQVHQHIHSESFSTYDGALVRRRMISLGKFIGKITLAQERPILSRFLDLKKILYYGFSQGKLYGIVPFVCSIFKQASSFFNPPNPYTTSIFHFLATIYRVDSLKTYIKQQIYLLFTQFNITVSMFVNQGSSFPSVVNNNYDFYLTPFSLVHMMPQKEVDKLLSFDESILSRYISSNIIMPEGLYPTVSPEIRERIRNDLTNHTVAVLLSEGQCFYKIASSTAIELINKDLSGCENLIEIGKAITKQYCSALTLSSTTMKFTRHFTNLKSTYNDLDSDWIDCIIVRNYEWITQMIRDIVKEKAWEIVRTHILPEEPLVSRKKASGISCAKPTISPQVLQIYSDFSEISMSQQVFPIYDLISAKEKSISIDPIFENYIQSCNKLLSIEGSQSPESHVDDSSIFSHINTCPTFEGSLPKIESVRSALRPIFIWVTKQNRKDVERVSLFSLEKILQTIPSSLIPKIQSYVLSWIWLYRSPYFIGELIRLNLILIRDLDVLLTDMMNYEPFSVRNAISVCQILYFLMIDTQRVEPTQMISTLTVLCSIPPGISELSQMPQLSTLTSLFEKKDVPKHHLSAASVLQPVSTFDPLEDIGDIEKIKEVINIYRTSLTKKNEGMIKEQTAALTQYGKNLFIVFFTTQTYALSRQLLLSLAEINELHNQRQNILDSLYFIIHGNRNVIGFDHTKHYYVLRYFLSHIYPFMNGDIIEFYAHFLHNLRPMIAPSFTFFWIELISDKFLIFKLISSPPKGFITYSVLLTDFCASICFNEPTTNKEAFQQQYNGFLRLLLVIGHDNPSYLAFITPILLHQLPFHFYQLRNILLSNNNFSSYSYHSLPQDILESFINEVNGLMNKIDTDGMSKLISRIEKNHDIQYQMLNEIIILYTDPKRTNTPTDFLNSFVQSITPDLAYSFVSVVTDGINSMNNNVLSYQNIIQTLLFSGTMCKTLCIGEIVMRVLIERLSVPPPHPSQLVNFMKLIFSMSPSIYKLRFIESNNSIISYLITLEKLVKTA